jgi:hypothetical protein
MTSLREIQKPASRAGGPPMFQWGHATIATKIEPHGVVPTICDTGMSVHTNLENGTMCN